MKKLALAVAGLLACLTILLPVVGSCNHSNAIPGSEPALYRADGWPMPPPIPPYNGLTNTDPLLVADGWPMPPPIPPYNGLSNSEPLLIADGWPMPPPIPPYSLNSQTVA